MNEGKQNVLAFRRTVSARIELMVVHVRVEHVFDETEVEFETLGHEQTHCSMRFILKDAPPQVRLGSGVFTARTSTP